MAVEGSGCTVSIMLQLLVRLHSNRVLLDTDKEQQAQKIHGRKKETEVVG
jgi:hypothetical protein